MRPSAVLERHSKECFLPLFLVLSWLAMASAFTLPADFHEGATKRTWGSQQQLIQRNSVHKQPIISSSRSRILAENASVWNTLNGSQPLVIARGGLSGLFPDQTRYAYVFAAASTTPASGALMCDMQLTKDGTAICRTRIDLKSSTDVFTEFPDLANTYNVNGQSVHGYFAIDLTSTQALHNITAVQSNPARIPYYDDILTIFEPKDVAGIVNNTLLLIWINVEYANFYTQHNLSMASALVGLMAQIPVDFVSSPEIAFLKAIKAAVPKNTPNLVLQFNGMDELEPTTNETYGSLLADLKTVATYASGILVPKEFIWPVNNDTGYLGAQTSLIGDAHSAGLAIYASGFVNDPLQPIYNYSYDPTREYLQYVPATGPNVDGFLTDFPATASEALECFRSTPTARKAGALPYVISHNGDSGNFPGCTMRAYASAVRGGASYIDCPVQMTSDGVLICRESPNLLTNTDAATHSDLVQARTSTIPKLQDAKGLFTFNLTWAQINGLKAKMYSPGGEFGVYRNPAYTQESILTLTDFLNYAKNTSVGILVNIQNGYFLETEVGLNVVGAVLASLNETGLNMSNRVLVQSEDSAVLRRLQQVSNYTLIYRVNDVGVLVTELEVAEVKALASYVTLSRRLIQATSSSFLLNKTNVVDQFHAQNISVFVSFLRNEFIALPYDYESDPILELNTLVQEYKVDGLVTDFPATAAAYLSNSCLEPTAPYSIFSLPPGYFWTVIPPNLPKPGPAPTKHLNVSEAETPLPTTFSPPPTSPTSASPAAAPASSTSPSVNAAAASCRGNPNILVLLFAALLIGPSFDPLLCILRYMIR